MTIQSLLQGTFNIKCKFSLTEIVLDGPLGKTKYYVLGIEFQE